MANKNNGMTSRISDYVQSHLAEKCRDYSDIIEEIQENKIHPSRNIKPKERIAFLRQFTSECLDYIGQIIADLRRLK